MSNEKLGAEQGRALIEECGLALAAEEITCGHKHVKTFNKLNELRELAEQAYHARDAAQLRHWTCRECSYQFDGGGNGVTYCPSCCKATLTEYVPNAPGAGRVIQHIKGCRFEGKLMKETDRCLCYINGPFGDLSTQG